MWWLWLATGLEASPTVCVWLISEKAWIDPKVLILRGKWADWRAREDTIAFFNKHISNIRMIWYLEGSIRCSNHFYFISPPQQYRWIKKNVHHASCTSVYTSLILLTSGLIGLFSVHLLSLTNICSRRSMTMMGPNDFCSSFFAMTDNFLRARCTWLWPWCPGILHWHTLFLGQKRRQNCSQESWVIRVGWATISCAVHTIWQSSKWDRWSTYALTS